MALLRLGELALDLVLKTELDGVVALFLLGLLLDNDARPRLDDGYRNDLASLIEDLRHADLFADDCFFHGISSCQVIGQLA